MLIRAKITLKVNKSEPNITCSLETLNLENSTKMKEIKKIFLISNSLRCFSHVSLR